MLKTILSASIVAVLLTACSTTSPPLPASAKMYTLAQPAPISKSDVEPVPHVSAAFTHRSEKLTQQLAHAKSLISSRQFEAAHAQLAALLSQHPDEPSVLLSLAKATMHLGRPVEGEALFERYYWRMVREQWYPADRILLILARLCRERNDIHASRSWLDKISPQEKSAYFLAQIQRSLLLSMEGDQAGALALVVSLSPESPEELLQVVLSKGRLLMEAGRPEEAFAVLEDGTPRVPQHAELLNLYASAANASGRRDIAESAARAAIQAAPGDYFAYNNLGFWLAERNERLNVALELISKAIELAPDNPNVLGSMGWVQYRLGDLSAAESFLRRACALDRDPGNVVQLSEVLWHKGERAEAKKLLREVSVSAPANKALSQLLARLQLTL